MPQIEVETYADVLDARQRIDAPPPTWRLLSLLPVRPAEHRALETEAVLTLRVIAPRRMGGLGDLSRETASFENINAWAPLVTDGLSEMTF